MTHINDLFFWNGKILQYLCYNDFNIDYDTKRHTNDAISIKLWVEEMKMLETQCPVLYYKGQDENDWTGK